MNQRFLTEIFAPFRGLNNIVNDLIDLAANLRVFH